MIADMISKQLDSHIHVVVETRGGREGGRRVVAGDGRIEEDHRREGARGEHRGESGVRR